MDATKENNNKYQRLMWVDWMKAIGIYLIVAGHFSAVGYEIVYAFNVPLFFLVSGFLSKRETDIRLFWKKLWFNMALPMILLCTIIFILKSLINIYTGIFELSDIVDYIIGLVTGFNSSTKGLWFVYTIICLKLILQYVPAYRWVQLVLFVSMPLLAVWLDEFQPIVCGRNIVEESNAIVNVTVAYPFFIIGFYIRKWKRQISDFRNIPIEIASFVCLALVLLFCASHNDCVRMYVNGYGNNFALFIAGGLSGTACVMILSKWFGNSCANVVETVSKGTVIILAFHYLLVPYIQRLTAPYGSGWDYLAALILTVAFIPVIIFVRRYMPYLIGKYRV